jgi:hypothetical protein
MFVKLNSTEFKKTRLKNLLLLAFFRVVEGYESKVNITNKQVPIKI